MLWGGCNTARCLVVALIRQTVVSHLWRSVRVHPSGSCSSRRRGWCDSHGANLVVHLDALERSQCSITFPGGPNPPCNRGAAGRSPGRFAVACASWWGHTLNDHRSGVRFGGHQGIAERSLLAICQPLMAPIQCFIWAWGDPNAASCALAVPAHSTGHGGHSPTLWFS